MNTDEHAQMLTEMVLQHHPNCPICGEKIDASNKSRDLTAAKEYNFGYGDFIAQPEKYAPLIELAHYDCWHMANDNKSVQ